MQSWVLHVPAGRGNIYDTQFSAVMMGVICHAESKCMAEALRGLSLQNGRRYMEAKAG